MKGSATSEAAHAPRASGSERIDTLPAHRYSYKYDPAGNRAQLAYYNGSTTATTTYGYSDFNQLTTRTAYGYCEHASTFDPPACMRF